jgi:hypothetical protein
VDAEMLKREVVRVKRYIEDVEKLIWREARETSYLLSGELSQSYYILKPAYCIIELWDLQLGYHNLWFESS